MEGYDAPADAQLAVDLGALGVLPLLLQLLGVGEASRLLVRLRQTLKVKLVHLDGHPANGGGGGSTLKKKLYAYIVIYDSAKKKGKLQRSASPHSGEDVTLHNSYITVI